MTEIIVRLSSVLLLLFLGACSATDNGEVAGEPVFDDARKPNLVIFYIDDLGYGDVGSYGAVGVQTPNIDKLAANGIRFTDAHSTAATCTPSRYSLLTGEHGFRVEADILEGDAPLLIRPGKPTIAAMLKRAGYATAVVGKWHLGLGDGDMDWNGDISPGPPDIGFDFSFLLPATGDRVPTVYVENRVVVDLEGSDPIEVSYGEKVGNRPTGYEEPELLRFKQTRSTATLSSMGSVVSGIWAVVNLRYGWTRTFRMSSRQRPCNLSVTTRISRSSYSIPSMISMCRACRTAALKAKVRWGRGVMP